MDSNVDIVIPWVDDSDPIWLKKKSRYMDNVQVSNELATENRFFDYGTLKYVLRSIEKNMPWIHNVFLLTDQQRPDWINSTNLTVVDHKDFIKGTLPTFNSNVIMTNINHIPNLSDKFIVFNDEFIVWKPTQISDFFKNGIPVDSLIETGTVPFEDGFFHISQNGVAICNSLFSKRVTIKNNLNKFFNYKYGIQNLRTLLSLPYGGFIGFQNQHLTIAYKKMDFNNAYKLCPEVFNNTWKHRFRQFDDINEWVVRYIRNLNGDFIPGYLKGQFFTLSNFKNKLPSIKYNSKIIVINDDGCYDSEVFKNLNTLLSKQFSEKSKYEK